MGLESYETACLGMLVTRQDSFVNLEPSSRIIVRENSIFGREKRFPRQE